MLNTRRLSSKFMLGLALFGSAAASQAGAACQHQMSIFNKAAVQSDVQIITQALNKLESSSDCNLTEKLLARRATANRLFRLAYHGSTAGWLNEEVDAMLRQSEAIAPTWRTLSFSATRDHQSGHYTAAARRFQAALALIDDTFETPKPPTHETIAQLHQMASESLLLADEFVAPPLVRGVSSGVLAASVRGFSVRRAPLPIRFETGSTKFTTQGKQAAEALLVALRAQGAEPIELIGHADERGSSDYNDQLSLQRAEKVKNWLSARGLQRQVSASGRGEREPLQLSASSEYSQEQRWQLNRRVELVRKP